MATIILSLRQSAQVDAARSKPAREREAEIMAAFNEAAQSPAPIVTPGLLDFLAIRVYEATMAALIVVPLLVGLLVCS